MVRRAPPLLPPAPPDLETRATTRYSERDWFWMLDQAGIPRDQPPPAAPAPTALVAPLVAPLRRAAIERAAVRLAWAMVGCTVVLAAAILAAAWGRW